MGENIVANSGAPEEDAMADAIDIRDDGPMIVATALRPDCTPERALAAFTDPARVSSWWRGHLTAELKPGGDYIVEFAAIPAKLTAQILSFDPGNSLGFTWSWNNESPDSTVQITVERGPDATSALLRLKHGPHSDDEPGRLAHQEHWDGWQYFLPRLVAELR
jgi:uncharacterized protein YndB with AHSA1/START domain